MILIYSNLGYDQSCLICNQEKNGLSRAALVAQQFSAVFGPGCDPGDQGLSPMLGSLHCMEPASPSACVSAPPPCVSHE